ncbi:flavin-containing monooxygenase [Streptomyces mexicanus]|nr:NAD(P)/FAD-dependent oxidoreductase [Streptomyces mexicanus]
MTVVRSEPETYDVVVVGAGFSGLYMLHELRRRGFSSHVFEAGTDVGGTWYWNRYPGARCDVESLFYSYSFSPELTKEWVWTERYPAQPEILAYLQHVADRFDLRRDISFSTRVDSVVFDEASHRWQVSTETGRTVTARYVVTAVGCLSSAQTPAIPGLDSFRGATYHTGQWPKEGVDFTGKRVGLIGTGSSGIQATPVIAEQADRLTVFQRTPSFSVPAHNHPLSPETIAAAMERYDEVREQMRHSPGGTLIDAADKSLLEMPDDERRELLERAWKTGGAGFVGTFPDALVNREANKVVADFVADKIRSIVNDPAVADRLIPSTYPIGAKRICVDTDYYATFNRDNVELVDVGAEPIQEIVPQGLKVGDRIHEVDAIVFATGYDAMTGSLARLGIVGVDGVRLTDKWAAGPETYLGVATSGFPNLFMLTGPGSPSVLSNMVVSIEQHVDWVADFLDRLRSEGAVRVEADRVAETEWVAHVNEVANHTLYPQANSWYLGANVPGKPRIFMPYAGGVGAYRERCDAEASRDYPGFHRKR